MTRVSFTGHRLAGCVLFVLLAGKGVHASAAETAADATRSAFVAAYASATDAAASDPPLLRSYLLYPYLQAARLARALQVAGAAVPPELDERIESFVEAQDPQPVAQPLRRSWLVSLAERAQWERFLAHHRDAIDGPALRCQAFAARIGLQQLDGLAPEVTKAWLTPRSLPDCDRAFTWLRASGGLDDTLVDSREPSRAALQRFNYCWRRYSQPPQDVHRGPWAGYYPPSGGRSGSEEPPVTPRTPLLVYVTGRSAESFRQLVVRRTRWSWLRRLHCECSQHVSPSS